MHCPAKGPAKNQEIHKIMTCSTTDLGNERKFVSHLISFIRLSQLRRCENQTVMTSNVTSQYSRHWTSGSEFLVEKEVEVSMISIREA